MDKYLTVVLIFLVGGMGIGAMNQIWGMFWAMIAGVIGVILYSSYSTRLKRREERRRRRR